MKRNTPMRMTITAKDVANLMGKTQQTAWRLLRQIRQDLGKKQKHITIAEFAAYMEMSEEYIRSCLKI